MYIATETFRSAAQGLKKKGDEVEFHQLWLDAGLIEEKPLQKSDTMETKPEPKKKRKGK